MLKYSPHRPFINLVLLLSLKIWPYFFYHVNHWNKLLLDDDVQAKDVPVEVLGGEGAAAAHDVLVLLVFAAV